MKTLVQWCLSWGVSVDIARRTIRKNPELQQLGTQVGCSKGYSELEAQQILGAMNTTKAKTAVAK